MRRDKSNFLSVQGRKNIKCVGLPSVMNLQLWSTTLALKPIEGIENPSHQAAKALWWSSCPRTLLEQCVQAGILCHSRGPLHALLLALSHKPKDYRDEELHHVALRAAEAVQGPREAEAWVELAALAGLTEDDLARCSAHAAASWLIRYSSGQNAAERIAEALRDNDAGAVSALERAVDENYNTVKMLRNIILPALEADTPAKARLAGALGAPERSDFSQGFWISHRIGRGALEFKGMNSLEFPLWLCRETLEMDQRSLILTIPVLFARKNMQDKEQPFKLCLYRSAHAIGWKVWSTKKQPVERKTPARFFESAAAELGVWILHDEDGVGSACAQLLCGLVDTYSNHQAGAFKLLAAALIGLDHWSAERAGELAVTEAASMLTHGSGGCRSNEGATAMARVLIRAVPQVRKKVRASAAAKLEERGKLVWAACALCPEGAGKAGEALMSSNGRDASEECCLAMSASKLDVLPEKALKNACDGVRYLMASRNTFAISQARRLLDECTRRINDGVGNAAAAIEAGSGMAIESASLLREGYGEQQHQPITLYDAVASFVKASKGVLERGNGGKRAERLRAELLEGHGATVHPFLAAAREDDEGYASGEGDDGDDLADFIVCGVPGRDYKEFLAKRQRSVDRCSG